MAPCTAGVPAMGELYDEFHDKDTEIVMVYCREAHPGGRFPQCATYEERLAHAREFRQRHGAKYTIVVNPIDNSIQEAYGSLPNMAYVIDKRGLIAYRANWVRPTEIADVLRGLWEREEQRALGMKLQPVYSERVTYRPAEENLYLEQVTLEVFDEETDNTTYLAETFGEEYSKAIRERAKQRQAKVG